MNFRNTITALTMDYDVCINFDVDAMVRNVVVSGCDFVALPIENIENLDEWVWRKPHTKVYSSEEIEGYLLSAVVISRDAARCLANRRREMAVGYKDGNIKFWPFCDAFMPTKLKGAGFRIGNIGDFGNRTT